jgi:hypothetical protein
MFQIAVSMACWTATRVRVRSLNCRIGSGGTNDPRTRPCAPSWASQARCNGGSGPLLYGGPRYGPAEDVLDGQGQPVTSGTVFSVDGYPSPLEGEPPIAKSKGGT